jgi:hypothetical protein
MCLLYKLAYADGRQPKRENTSEFAQCIELVAQMSTLIFAFIYVTVFLLEYLLGIPPSSLWEAALKEE